MREVEIDLYHRIQDYLSSGGLVNPELMDHDKVRDLLVDCRNNLIVSLRAQRYEFIQEDHIADIELNKERET
jgi:hypothetical protein